MLLPSRRRSGRAPRVRVRPDRSVRSDTTRVRTDRSLDYSLQLPAFWLADRRRGRRR
jgi:hypothetical protein